MKKQEKTRFSLEMSQAVRERIENLKALTDAHSITEVIRRSLAVYEALCLATQNGEEIVIRGADKERTLLLS